MNKASSWMATSSDEETQEPRRSRESANWRSDADFETALQSLDKRLSDIAAQLGREHQPHSPEFSDAGGVARQSLAEAIVDIARGRNASANAYRDAPPSERTERPEPRRSYDEPRRASAAPPARSAPVERDDQRRYVSEQVGKLRGEVAALARLLGDFAPRSSIVAIESALKTLADRIESQRSRGVQESLLAPVERLAEDLRTIVKEIDPEPALRGLRAEMQGISRRLEDLRASRNADSSTVADLTKQIGDTRSVMSAMASRLLPLEKIETRLLELTRRVEALDASNREHARNDLVEVVRAVRTIVATEFSGALPAFGQRLEALDARLDALLTKAEGSRGFEELLNRIDESHDSITARMDRDAASRPPVDLGQVETLLSQLANKIDASLELKPVAERRFAELAQRIDQSHHTLAARIEQGAATSQTAIAKITQLLSAPPTETRLDELAGRMNEGLRRLQEKLDDGLRPRGGDSAQLMEAVGQLAKKIDVVVAPRADHQSMMALSQQIDKLSRRLERDDQSASTLASIEQTLGLMLRRFDETSGSAPQAEEAARRAATAVLREASSGLDSVVERKLADLRKIEDDGARRVQETLSTVQETLGRVVERLAETREASREPTWGVRAEAPPPSPPPPSPPPRPDPQDMLRAPPAARPAPPPGAESRMPLRPSVAALDDVLHDRSAPPDELDSETELILPVSVAEPNAAEQQPRRESSRQADFIAAARRAAQQAAADAEAAARAAGDRNSGARSAQKPASGAVRPAQPGPVSYFRSRKRPFLLALGALVMLAGAYQIARLNIELPFPPSVASHREAEGAMSAGGGAKSADAPDHVRAAPNAASVVPSTKFLSPLGVSPPPPPSAEPAGSGSPTRKQNPGPSASLDGAPTGAIGDASPANGALETVKSLAAQGDASAQFELGARYSEGQGLSRDPLAAAQWFEKAAFQGFAPAEYRVGSIYEKGLGVERSHEKAREWYERAARHGNVRAMHNLAVMFAEGGDDGKPNYGMAAEWFRRAAEHGVRDSQYNLGILCARGLGIEKNLGESYKWFALAAAQGDEDAAKKRDEVALRLDATELAAAKALADEFRPAPFDKSSNEFSAPSGGWETPRNSKSARPPKAKMSAAPAGRS